MPERPDLEYVVPRLAAGLAGARIASVRVKKPVVLRVAVPGKIEDLLRGRAIGAVERRAHFVTFDLGDLELVIAPMLAGRFGIAEASARSAGDLAVAFGLEDGRELRYGDDVQMGKVYVIARGDRAKVPGLTTVGIDVLSPEFTREALRRLVKGRRDQVKVFLMDRTALDAMGNAYADEVLWAARLHPKTFTGKLAPQEVDRLHDAIVEVLSSARGEIARRAPPLDEKVRDFLKVRGRNGQPCPRCGTKIRSAGVHGHDAEFCPTCQPEPRAGIVDWSRTSAVAPPAEGKPPPGTRRRRR